MFSKCRCPKYQRAEAVAYFGGWSGASKVCRKFKVNPNNSKQFQNIPKYSELFQVIPKYSKIFQIIPNFSKLFQNIVVTDWALLFPFLPICLEKQDQVD